MGDGRFFGEMVSQVVDYEKARADLFSIYGRIFAKLRWQIIMWDRYAKGWW